MLKQDVTLLVVESSSDLMALLGGWRGHVESCHGASCTICLYYLHGTGHRTIAGGQLFVEQFYRKIKATAVRGQSG